MLAVRGLVNPPGLLGSNRRVPLMRDAVVETDAERARCSLRSRIQSQVTLLFTRAAQSNDRPESKPVSRSPGSVG